MCVCGYVSGCACVWHTYTCACGCVCTPSTHLAVHVPMVVLCSFSAQLTREVSV